MDTPSRRKILVAQQQPQDRDFTTRFLETIGGYEVSAASDGLGLIKALKSRPDLIITDTPQSGGFPRAIEIVRRTKTFDAVPILVYSQEQHQAETFANKGVNGFIVKPAAPAAFLAKLWRVLGEEGQKAAVTATFSEQFRKDLDGIDGLPTLPTVFAEVNRLCQDPDVGADRLSRVIETDPSITLKLLSLANSAFFGFSRRIHTVKESISLLGNTTVKNAILNIAVYEASKGLSGSAGLDKPAFWVHAAAVGSVARFLSGKLKLNRDEAFTAGIVHDVGKLILDALYTDFYKDVLAQVASGKVSLYEAEDDIIGLTHCQVGAEVAGAWNLGQELTEAIAHHHHPSRAEADPQIAGLVHVGDVVARRLKAGSGGDDTQPGLDEAALKALGLPSGRLDEWDAEIKEAVGRDRSILSVLNS